jgi:hypothetical protein
MAVDLTTTTLFCLMTTKLMFLLKQTKICRNSQQELRKFFKKSVYRDKEIFQENC